MENLTSSNYQPPAPHRALSAQHTTAMAIGDPLPERPSRMQGQYRELVARLNWTKALHFAAWFDGDAAADRGYDQQECAYLARLAALAAAYYDATGREIEPGRIVGGVAA